MAGHRCFSRTRGSGYNNYFIVGVLHNRLGAKVRMEKKKGNRNLWHRPSAFC